MKGNDPHSAHPPLPARFQERTDEQDGPDDLEQDEEGFLLAQTQQASGCRDKDDDELWR